MLDKIAKPGNWSTLTGCYYKYMTFRNFNKDNYYPLFYFVHVTTIALSVHRTISPQS